MQLSAEQQYALSQIGIPLWVRRNEQAQPTTSPDPEPVGLTAGDFSKSWAVVVEKSLTATELRLLRAILRSVDISYDSIAIVEKASATALSQFDKQQTIGLVLGNRVAQALDLQQDEQTGGQRLHNGMLMLVGQELQQLLAEPEKKAEMWQTLSQLQRLRASWND